MKTYTAEIVSDILTIEAKDEKDAQRKYEAFWYGEPCPDHKKQSAADCGCVEHTDGHSYHTIKEDTWNR